VHACPASDTVAPRQVLTDDASNCKTAWPLLEARFPWMTCGGCVPHSLDLLSEKWGKIEWVKDVICQAQAVTRCVVTHQSLLAAYRDQLHGKVPQRPGATRFMSYFILLQSAYESRDAYEKLAVTDAWKVWFFFAAISVAALSLASAVSWHQHCSDTALCLVCLQNFSKSAAGKKTDDRVSERAATESTQSFRRSYTCKDLKGFVLSDDWWATVQKVTHLMVRVLFCWPVE
jgi:hypothetical protein